MTQSVRFKFGVIVVMTLLLGLVLFSGYSLSLGKTTLFWHTIFIVLFLIFLSIHIFLKKKKIINMTKDVLHEPQKSQEHSGYLVKKLKGRTFKEICLALNIEHKQLESFFKEHHVEITNYDDSLEKIAKENDYNPLKLLATIISIDITNKTKDKNVFRTN